MNSRIIYTGTYLVISWSINQSLFKSVFTKLSIHQNDFGKIVNVETLNVNKLFMRKISSLWCKLFIRLYALHDDA